MATRWEHFAHGADIGVRGIGETPADAFAEAALALTAAIAEPSCIEPRQPVEIRCRESDPALLLVDWLNALVFEMATRHMLFSRFEVRIDDGELTATAWGEPVEPARHEPAVEVKGATMTELAVSQNEHGWWRAQCVVDV